MTAPNTFEKAGFSAVTADVTKRMLVGSQGRHRTGKTDWSIRDAPDPIILISVDFGHEGVVEKFAEDKELYIYTQNIPPVANQSQYLDHWKRLRDKIEGAMTHPNVRTVVLDTGSEIWELLRLAEFGSLVPRGDVKQLYGQINRTYSSLIKMAYDREINLVVSHKMKKKYINRTIQTQKGAVTQDVWEGDYERTGFGESEYLIQINIEHLFDPTRGKKLEDHFGLRVLSSRQNMGIVGLELWGKDCSFCELASYVFEGTDPDDWRKK